MNTDEEHRSYVMKIFLLSLREHTLKQTNVLIKIFNLTRIMYPIFTSLSNSGLYLHNMYQRYQITYTSVLHNYITDFQKLYSSRIYTPYSYESIHVLSSMHRGITKKFIYSDF